MEIHSSIKRKTTFPRSQHWGVPVEAPHVKNLTQSVRMQVQVPGLAQWAKDPALLQLWRRLAAAALIRPQPGNLIMPQMRPEKENKNFKKDKALIIANEHAPVKLDEILYIHMMK